MCPTYYRAAKHHAKLTKIRFWKNLLRSICEGGAAILQPVGLGGMTSVEYQSFVSSYPTGNGWDMGPIEQPMQRQKVISGLQIAGNVGETSVISEDCTFVMRFTLKTGPNFRDHFRLKKFDYMTNNTIAVGLAIQKQALNSVHSMDVATEQGYQVKRQGTLVVIL